jgi:hypothetical protein
MTEKEAKSRAAKLTLKLGKAFVAIRWGIKVMPLEGGMQEQWIISTPLKVLP